MQNRVVPVLLAQTSQSQGLSSCSDSVEESHSPSNTPSDTCAHVSAPSSKHKAIVQRVRTFKRQFSTHSKQHASAILNGQEVTGRALYLFHPAHSLRRFCIYLCNSRWFPLFNLLLIMMNCVVLMMESGRNLGNSYTNGGIGSALNVMDAIFTAFFALEMLVKVIAGGLYYAGPTSYLRSWWNRLDCLVVCFALANFIPGMSNLTYIRALRLFRPLKAANNLPGLRVMMNSMIAAAMTLGNLFMFVFLLLFTFAMFGLQFYDGAFRYRCLPLGTDVADFDISYGFACCSPTGLFWNFIGPHLCNAGSYCADIGISPYANAMSYDNILRSWVMSLIVMSGEGWSDIMYAAEDTVCYASWIYFVLLTCLSNYLAGELLVAVMSVKFEDAKSEEQIKMKEEEEQKEAVREAKMRIRYYKRNLRKEAKNKTKALEARQKNSPLPKTEQIEAEKRPVGASVGGLAKLVGDMETAQIMQLADVIKRQNRQKAANKASRQAKSEGGTESSSSRPDTAYSTNTPVSTSQPGRAQTFVSASAKTLGLNNNSGGAEFKPRKLLAFSTRRSSILATANSGNNLLALTPTTAGTKIIPPLPLRVASLGRAPRNQNAHSPVHSQKNESSAWQTDLTSQKSPPSFHTSRATTFLINGSKISDSSKQLSSTSTWIHSSSMLSHMHNTFHNAKNAVKKFDGVTLDVLVPLPGQRNFSLFAAQWYTVRSICHRLIFSQTAFWLYSLFTILNVAVLCIDSWDMSQELAVSLLALNTTFFALFMLEFVMRLIALELEYFKHGYLVLDFVTVVFALIDTAFAGSSNVLNGLRAFRVFRMFTVLRHWKAMQRIMKQAHSSVEDLFYFAIVLFLFVFMFAQVGVQVAQYKENFPQPEGPASDNWDSIGWAMLVVFQISTPENWNQVLYDIVQGVGWGGGFFVIVTLAFMHYIIESLFVVVMFSHFGTNPVIEEQQKENNPSAAVAPIDHVQQMINRAQDTDTVDGAEQSTATDNLHPLTRDTTYFEFTTPRALHSGPAYTFALGSPLTPTNRLVVQEGLDDERLDESDLHSPASIHKGWPADRSTPKSLSSANVLNIPPPQMLSRAQSLKSPSASIKVPNIIQRSKGFLGRLVRNIEHSRIQKAQEDRAKEIEKFRRSGSNSKHTSRNSNHRASHHASPEPSVKSGFNISPLYGNLENVANQLNWRLIDELQEAKTLPVISALAFTASDDQIQKEGKLKLDHIVQNEHECKELCGPEAVVDEQVHNLLPIMTMNFRKHSVMLEPLHPVLLPFSHGHTSSLPQAILMTSAIKANGMPDKIVAPDIEPAKVLRMNSLPGVQKENLKMLVQPALTVTVGSNVSNTNGFPSSHNKKEEALTRPPTYAGHIRQKLRRFVIAHHSPPPQPWYRQDKPEPFTESSLYYFTPKNRLRVLFCDLLHSDAWSIGVIVLIFVSCLLLAMDYPALDSTSAEAIFLYYADILTTCLYIVEMVMRFIVFGAIIGKQACLRNGWNFMEFIIIIFSIASIVFPQVGALKALRALRPLRVLSRLPGAKVVVSSLGKSILNIGNVLVLAFILLLSLSIVAVSLYKGRLQQCLSVPDGSPISVNEDACAIQGGIWTNPIWAGNYDNIAASLLVLFELCTEENWPGTMMDAVDATDPGLAPENNYNQWNGLFFVVSIMVGSLFVKTLFTATILDGYSFNYAEIIGGGGDASPLQQQWLDFYKLAIDNLPPLSKPRPSSKWFSRYDLRVRRFFFDLAKLLAFEYFFLGVISINVMALCMSYRSQPEWYTNMLDTVNSTCTWMFVAEVIILWLGSGIRPYFRSWKNQFDFTLAILTVYEFFYEENFITVHIGFNPSIFRVIRMLRIFRLFSKSPRLVQLGKTVLFSLPALYNVTFLMILEYFIYSILGMALFGNVKYGYFMTRHGNYKTFTSAMLTLFREMTGENWNGIMRDCMVQPPFCDPAEDNCGNTILSPLFHVTFQILSAMLVMDLIVAIILNQFENTMQKEKRSGDALISEADMKKFGEHWAHFARGHYTMHLSKLPTFLRYLPQPFNYNKNQEALFGTDMAHYLDELKIPCNSDSVHYLDVVHQLAYRVFINKFPEINDMEHEEEETIRDLLNEDESEDEDEEIAKDRVSPIDAAGKKLSKSPSRWQSILKSITTRIARLPSQSFVHFPYTVAGIRLANEDLMLITRQAQRQFPTLMKNNEWCNIAGQVHRIIICQKIIRGVFERKRLREKFVKPALKKLIELNEHHITSGSSADNKPFHQVSSSNNASIEAEDTPTDTKPLSSSCHQFPIIPQISEFGSNSEPFAIPQSMHSRRCSVIEELMSIRAQSKDRVSGNSDSMNSPLSSGSTVPVFRKAASLPLDSTQEKEEGNLL